MNSHPANVKKTTRGRGHADGHADGNGRLHGDAASERARAADPGVRGSRPPPHILVHAWMLHAMHAAAERARAMLAPIRRRSIRCVKRRPLDL